MNKLVIREWAEADRPREKMMQHGRRALSDAELLAILIGSGSRDESAVELCRRLLSDVSNNLDRLSKLEFPELKQYKGIGEAKAITILAALELGRRRKESKEDDRPILNSSKRVFEYFREQLQDLPYEEFWVLYLNTACRLIDKQMIGRGGDDFTPVDVKVILRHALHHKANFIVLVHNHPSGALKPSYADKQITKRIREASTLLEIKVSDHIIFTDSGCFSFRDEGLMV